MFWIFSLRNNSKLNSKDDKRIKEYIDMFANTSDGSWLNDIPYNKFKMKWCHAMNLKNGVMGAFTSFAKNTVYLAPDKNPFMYRGENARLIEIMPTLIHELRHAWQRKKFGLFYIILAFPFVRERTIEVYADGVYEQAEAFFSKPENQPKI